MVGHVAGKLAIFQEVVPKETSFQCQITNKKVKLVEYKKEVIALKIIKRLNNEHE